jgi:hypothetical protein
VTVRITNQGNAPSLSRHVVRHEVLVRHKDIHILYLIGFGESTLALPRTAPERGFYSPGLAPGLLDRAYHKYLDFLPHKSRVKAGSYGVWYGPLRKVRGDHATPCG